VVGGKQRLAGVLSHPERRLVAQAMAARCLRCAMATWPADRVVVVGAGEEIARLAARHRVGTVLADRGAGQSAAVALGAGWVAAQGFTCLVTVAGDLPEVEVADLAWLRELAEGLAGPGVVAVPDAGGTGTNALVVSPPTADVLAFGPDSLRRHRQRAGLLGLPFRCQPRARIARDCDRPEDLAALLVQEGAAALRRPPSGPARPGPGPI